MVAVDSLNIKVHEREIFGFIGPNGAGKTTTIRMLSGLLRPTSGTAHVAGLDILKKTNEVKSRIGLVPELSNIYTDLSARYNLEFMAKMYRVPERSRGKRIDALLEEFGLADRQNALASTFSKGMQRRLAIASALVHDPSILFLDELTTGLDVQSARSIHEKLRDLNKNGATILLSTHRMHEIEELCDRVGIIDRGRLVACATVDTLRQETGEFDIIELFVHGQGSLLRWLQESELAKRVDFVEEDNSIRVEVENSKRSLPEILRMAEKLGQRVRSVSVREARLEDIFIKLTGRAIREEQTGNYSVGLQGRGYKQ